MPSNSAPAPVPITGPLLQPASGNREYVTVFNDIASGGTIKILLGEGVSATVYSHEIEAGDLYETPRGYKGPIDILPTGGATGQLTEIR